MRGSAHGGQRQVGAQADGVGGSGGAGAGRVLGVPQEVRGRSAQTDEDGD